MTLIERINIIPRRVHRDERGALLKALCGDEPGLQKAVGEVYVVWGEPGHSRGGHYHNLTDEFFTLLEGCCELVLADPLTNETSCLQLNAQIPATVHVPRGIAHAFRNQSATKFFILLAYADRGYDPSDTVPYRF